MGLHIFAEKFTYTHGIRITKRTQHITTTIATTTKSSSFGGYHCQQFLFIQTSFKTFSLHSPIRILFSVVIFVHSRRYFQTAFLFKTFKLKSLHIVRSQFRCAFRHEIMAPFGDLNATISNGWKFESRKICVCLFKTKILHLAFSIYCSSWYGETQTQRISFFKIARI